MATTETIETREITVNGITYKVEIEPDYDVRPESDGDWASQEDIDSWKRDEWRYVGIIVTPVIDGNEIDSASVASWGATWGTLPGNPVEFDMDYTCNVDPVPDMIKEVNGKLETVSAKLIAALQAFQADQD